MNTGVLVTGGTGVLGRHLVRLLIAQNSRVTILCRNPQPELFGTHTGISWLQGDVSLPELGLASQQYQQLLSQTDKVFHLAARTDFKGATLEEYRPVNIQGVQNIYSFAIAARAQLHHVSTAFVCGHFQKTFTEAMLDQGQGFRNFYEESKFKAEVFLRNRQQEALANGVRVTIYRPGIILERKPTASSSGKFGPFTFLDALFRIVISTQKNSTKATVTRVEGNSQGSMPFIFDDQVAKALYNLSCQPGQHGKTFHLTTRTPFANRVIETLFNEAFGQPVVCWASPEIFIHSPKLPAEELLARRTKVYSRYLDLSLNFARTNLENGLGNQALPDLTVEEVLDAFSRFLTCKKEATLSRKKTAAHPAQNKHNDITAYFTTYLPAYLNQPLLKNLVSLNALFWLNIRDVGTWNIRIVEGCLHAISSGRKGIFGYTVNAETFLQVVQGLRSPQEGFFRGQISISGNTKEGLRTATALEEFFSTYPYRQEGLKNADD